MNIQLDEFKTPPRKLLSKLLTGRDKLKNKYQAVREQLRVARNQATEFGNSHQLWNNRAISAEKKVDAMKEISLIDAANREQASRTEDPDKGLVPEGNSSNTLIAFPDPSGLRVNELLQDEGRRSDRQSPTSGIALAMGKVSGSHFDLGCIIAVVRFVLAVETSNGEVVKEQFNKSEEKNGVPGATLSDAGSDLSRGTRLFQAEHPQVVPLYDIQHLVSRTVEKIMVPQEQWDSFRSACTTCANTVRQSTLAHLKPPRPKTKARYMNIDREIQWAARMLWVLDRVRSGHLTDVQKKRLPQQLVEEKFSWLDQYRNSINQWEQLSHTSRAVLSEVRRHSYGACTIEAITNLNTPGISEASRNLIDQVTERIRPMCESGEQFDRLPSSSEILESMMGRAKRLLSGTAEGTTNSLTGQILSLVACTREITPSLVRAALSTVCIECVSKWFSDNFTTSVNYQRSQDLTPTPANQNVRKPKPVAISNF